MIREYCVKVAPGKGAEYAAFLRDVMVPLNQSRADAGEFSWYAVVRSVVPAGTSAPCDYRLAYGYKGLPPEEASTEAIDAALKRAKMTLTGEQLAARRVALTTLAAVEIWGEIDGIGAPPQKNAYIRFNRYRTKSGEFDEWVRLERATWKPVMDAWLKAGGKGSWSLNVLGAPGGESTPYNGMTVDIFPDWNGLMQGVPADELWPKVHPGTARSTRSRSGRSSRWCEASNLRPSSRAKSSLATVLLLPSPPGLRGRGRPPPRAPAPGARRAPAPCRAA